MLRTLYFGVCSFIHSFIYSCRHSLNRCLLRVSYIPGTLKKFNKTYISKNHCICGLQSRRKSDNKQETKCISKIVC